MSNLERCWSFYIQYPSILKHNNNRAFSTNEVCQLMIIHVYIHTYILSSCIALRAFGITVVLVKIVIESISFESNLPHPWITAVLMKKSQFQSRKSTKETENIMILRKLRNSEYQGTKETEKLWILGYLVANKFSVSHLIKFEFKTSRFNPLFF